MAKPAGDDAKWITLSSGLQYVDKTTGTGKEAKSGQSVKVHYKGWLDNGTVFDESRRHGSTFEFVLGTGHVIQGWDEGVQGMKVGGVRQLKIPPALGYGPAALPGIPANSTLHFDVELVDVL